MRRCVWSRNLKNGEALARVGRQRGKKKEKKTPPKKNKTKKNVKLNDSRCCTLKFGI